MKKVFLASLLGLAIMFTFGFASQNEKDQFTPGKVDEPSSLFAQAKEEEVILAAGPWPTGSPVTNSDDNTELLGGPWTTG